MVARLPLRTLLRDIVMMLCGSILGMLLAQGFTHHDLRMADVSHLCGAVQMTKRVEKSQARDQPFLFLGRGSGGGEEGEGEGGSGKGEGKSSGDGLESQDGSGDDASNAVQTQQDRDNYQDTRWYQDTLKHWDSSTSQDTQKYQDTSKYQSKHQDTSKYQDTSRYQDISRHQDTKVAKILVGVVTETDDMIETIMDTWGQSSNDVIFYSLAKSTSSGQQKWPWQGNKKGYDTSTTAGTRVVRVKPETPSTRTTQQQRLLPMLEHMYRNLLNQFDWFVLVPENTYVRLKETQALLANYDPMKAFVLGRPNDQDTLIESGSGGLEGGGGRCETGRGVVFSRQLLRKLGESLEACEEGAWHCIYKQAEIKCLHDNQLNSLFTDSTITPPHHLGKTTPTSHTHFLYVLHHNHLLEQLRDSKLESSSLREKLARNKKKLRTNRL